MGTSVFAVEPHCWLPSSGSDDIEPVRLVDKPWYHIDHSSKIHVDRVNNCKLLIAKRTYKVISVKIKRTPSEAVFKVLLVILSIT